MYFYAIEWHDGLLINLNGQFSDLFLLAMIYYITKTALIFWACETAKNQAQEIRTTKCIRTTYLTAPEINQSKMR